MNPPIQTIRLSKKEVDILSSVKRRTRISQWNILCRMAFCLSCSDPAEPQERTVTTTESGVELEWATFAGASSELYSALTIRHKMKTNSAIGTPEYFKNLLYRGIYKLKNAD